MQTRSPSPLPFRHIGVRAKSYSRPRTDQAVFDLRAGSPSLLNNFVRGPKACATLSGVTTANKITLVRILMIPVFVTLAIYYGQSIQRGAPLEWQRFAAIIVFLLAAASDGLDGYVARRYKQRSALGAILDPIADKGLLLSGIITLSITNWSQSDPNYGKFPVWFPVLVITRDAVILVGAAILHYFIGNKMKVKPSWTGKVATVCQMCAIAWVMLQLRFLPLWFVVTVAGIFTAISGVIYFIEGVRQLQAEGHAHAAR